jgi:hypothetical protein
MTSDDDWWGEDPPSPPAQSEPSDPAASVSSEPAESVSADPAASEPSEPAVGEPAEPAGSEPPEPAVSATSPGGSRRSRWLIGAAVAAVVVAIGIGVLVTRDDGGTPVAAGASAAGQGGPGGFDGFGRGTGGTITAIDADGSTLELEASSGDTVEVTATDDTTITETVEGSIDDLSEGDDIVVIGSATGDDGTIAADQVIAGAVGMPFGGDRPQPPQGGDAPPEGYGPPEGFDPGQGGGPDQGRGVGGFTRGTITDIGDGKLSVKTADDETVTVTLSSSTTVRVTHDLSFGDLAAGDEITVTAEGDTGDDATVQAVAIRRGDAGLGVPGGGGFPGGGNPGGGGDSGTADGSTT